MSISVCGLCFRTCPLEKRGEMVFTESQARDALTAFGNNCVLLSTCNRTELYLCSDGSVCSEDICRKLCKIKNTDYAEFKDYFYFKEEKEAVKHLLTVTAGLDSMIFGEDQILGQVKKSCGLAHETGCCTGLLDALFRLAVTSAKDIKSKTKLSSVSVSAGTIAARRIKDYFENSQRGVLVIGVGETGQITVKNLIANGIENIYATNRTHGKAVDLSKVFPNIGIVDYHNRYEALSKVGAVISCTSSPHFTMEYEKVKEAAGGREILMVDLAVPRDIDLKVRELPNVIYTDIDDIGDEIKQNMALREKSAEEARKYIEKYTDEFMRYYKLSPISDVIKQIEKVKRRIAEKQADDESRELVSSALNELTARVIYSVRDDGDTENVLKFFEMISRNMKEIACDESERKR